MAFVLVDELAAVGVDKAVAEEIAKNPTAAKALQEKFEGSMRQSDYDRFMNSKKAEFEAQRRQLQEEVTTFEKTKEAINKQYLEGLTSREQMESQLATVRAKAKTQSDIYGVDLVKELFGTSEPVVTPPRREEPKGNEYDDRIKKVEDLFLNGVKLQTQMMEISRQHQELFPDKPINFEEIMDDAAKQRRMPMQVWDDKYGASAKRADILADKYRAEGAAKAKEDLEKKYSGREVNAFRTDIPLSPAFAAANNKTLASPKDRAAGSAQSVQNAVDAFLSGKYRQGGGREATR
jgi:hypothetical protein